MGINKTKIISDLNLIPFGAKGWMRNEKLVCPECGRGDKFGINISGTKGGVHCFVCDFSQSIYKYLKFIGRTDLITDSEDIHTHSELMSIRESNSQQEKKKEEEGFEFPLGFRFIYEDGYLNSRKFGDTHYESFTPGVTDLNIEGLKNHIIFILYHKKKPVGFLARSRMDYQWHKENLENFKLGKGKLVLRYDISKGFDTNRFLGGFDEITRSVTTLILVEGLFDKVNIDNLLNLEGSENIKCCFTFGNTVSEEQMNLIKETGVKNIILMYDYGTMKQSKSYSLRLSNHFNTSVCELKNEEIDPGDMDFEYLSQVMRDKVSALDYFRSRL